MVYHLWMEDWPDEDTGDLIKITMADRTGNITTDEIELSPDNCILDGLNKEGGMLPITEYLYHTIGSKWENESCRVAQYQYDSKIRYSTGDAQALTEFEALNELGYNYNYSGPCGPYEANAKDVKIAEDVTLASLCQ